MQTATVPAQSSSATILFSRINSIISLIPADFPQKSSVEKALRGRQDSIRFTAPGAMNGRWDEVGQILRSYLPDPDKEKWARDIAELFSKDPD